MLVNNCSEMSLDCKVALINVVVLRGDHDEVVTGRQRGDVDAVSVAADLGRDDKGVGWNKHDVHIVVTGEAVSNDGNLHLIGVIVHLRHIGWWVILGMIRLRMIII